MVKHGRVFVPGDACTSWLTFLSDGGDKCARQGQKGPRVLPLALGLLADPQIHGY